eukprot:397246-Pelagomonas_calceolata.AAC.1
MQLRWVMHAKLHKREAFCIQSRKCRVQLTGSSNCTIALHITRGASCKVNKKKHQQPPQAGAEETLSTSQIEAELNRMYAYGSKHFTHKLRFALCRLPCVQKGTHHHKKVVSFMMPMPDIWHLSLYSPASRPNAQVSVGRASTGMDWTMPPSLLHTKAFAMNINNDAGEMVKMQ